jgi:menaquinone-dependent protoporphyrinogen oxidase
MAASVLVAYATRYGSTKEVAEAVAEVLREDGIAVDIKPLKDVAALDTYRAVVMGAPLQMFRWHKDGLGFLKRHRVTLSQMPVAVFALGPFNDVEKEWQEVRGQLQKELAKFPWFAPVDTEIVGGKFDPTTLAGRWKLLPALKKLPASDLRDWVAIKAWAKTLPEKLRLTDG